MAAPADPRDPRGKVPAPQPVRALDRQAAGVDGRMFAPSAERNGPELLPILQKELPQRGTLLEIGSGTGQHGAFLAPHFPAWRWLPSDLDDTVFASIRAWRDHGGATNIEEPRALDLTAPPPPSLPSANAMLCVNVLHIAPRAALSGLCRLASKQLLNNGVLAVYGPLFRANEVPATSNLAFHQRLLSRDPDYGVWRERDIVSAAKTVGLTLDRIVRMPCNNSTVLLRQLHSRP